MENVGSNQSLVKITNQILIVEEIRKHKHLSRSDLAKILKLSNPSISKNVEDLQNKGLIVEIGSVKTQIGRRPMMLEFNRNCGCVAAIDLSGVSIRICLSDLDGNIIEMKNVGSVTEIDREVISKVADILAELLEENKESCGPLCSICIGSPGNIDPVTGQIRYALRVRDFINLDLKHIFEKRFGVGVLVKNDVNLAVGGEHVFGIGAGVKNLVYVSVDMGVGAGLILSGNLYEGIRGFAGELGMTVTGVESELVSYNGNLDNQLDRSGSIETVLHNVRNAFKTGEETLLRQKCGSGDEIRFSDIAEAVAAGDSLCIGEVKKSARLMAVILHNINELLDVEMIIIGGGAAKLGDVYLDEIRSYLECCSKHNVVTVHKSVLGDNATIYGAISEATKLAVNQIINMQTA